MKIPPKNPLAKLDLAPPSGRPGAAKSLAKVDLDPAGRLAKAAPSQHDQLVKKTEQWVAQTFYGTLLKQMTDSPFKSELFSGGKGGEAFSGMYHQQLVERMSRAAGGKLVNGIVRRIEAKAAKANDAGASVSPRKPAAAADATAERAARPVQPAHRSGRPAEAYERHQTEARKPKLSLAA